MKISHYFKMLPGIGKLNASHILQRLVAVSCMLLVSSGAYARMGDFVPQNERIQTDMSPRIVGGSPVPAGERTFQVYLTEQGQQVCGGSIIADSWVLTAAHCVDGINLDSVVSGTQTLNSGGQRHSIAQIITHPKWTTNGFGTASDLALIKISDTFAANLERLQLATPAIMASSATPGTAGVVSGWGLTRGGDYNSVSNQLLQTTNTILSDSQCASIDGGGIDSSIVLCAQDANRSSCNGDSGGPFTVVNNNVTYSIGIVSFGPTSCSGMSAYTKTSAFTSWIQSQIGGSTGGGGGTNDSVLVNKQAVTVSGSQGENVNYSFTLPTGVTSYQVSISGGSGDADLYVRKDSQPTAQAYDCRPYLNGNNETCSANSPAAGTYYVMLNGYAAFSNVSLLLSYEGGSPTPTPTPTPTPSPASCPVGYASYTGVIGGSGQELIGSEYYAASGQHSAINKGTVSVRMDLYKKGWSSWSRVASSTSTINYTGRRGTYALTVNGAPNSPYSVCQRTP